MKITSLRGVDAPWCFDPGAKMTVMVLCHWMAKTWNGEP